MKRTKVLNTNIAANLPAETAERPAFPQGGCKEFCVDCFLLGST